MHALSWIHQHGRFRRQISAAELRHALDRPRRHCTWCGRPVGKGRSTWCSDHCVLAFRSRCDLGLIRSQVRDRDRGVCAVCRTDTKANARRTSGILHQMWNFYEVFGLHRSRRANSRGRMVAARCRCPACQLIDTFEWEADHITPVVEGGGLCTAEGYRTLCLRCHKRETAALAGRRAQARRATDPQLQLI